MPRGKFSRLTIRALIRCALMILLWAVFAKPMASSATLKDLYSCFAVRSLLTGQTEPQAMALEVGKTIERELAGGQKHDYQIALSEGQYIRVEVSQKGIDVGVNLQLPDGRIINQYVPFGGQPELIRLDQRIDAGIPDNRSTHRSNP